MSDTVPGLVRSAAEKFGDATAYSMDGRTLTFTELHDLVRRTAAVYRRHGVQPGSRVVLWAPNSIDWVVAGLAATYAGGVLVPANSRYTAHEVADIINRTDATTVVVANGFLGRTQIADLREVAPLAPVIDLADIGALAAQADEADLAAVERRPTPSVPTTSPTSCSPPAPPVAPRAWSPRTGSPSPRARAGPRSAR